MNLPTLYKKTNTGAIQFWTISVRAMHDGIQQRPGFTGKYPDEYYGEVVTTYGQLGTDSPQTTVDAIKKGKNLGKINATNAVEQAFAEAQAKWEKQKKKGYVETKEGAEAGELDDLIEGGELPMLAETHVEVIYDHRKGHENDPPTYEYTKESKKIKWPAYAQPKLDGIRCIAIINNGEVTLWSRTRKPIRSVPHIVQELEAAFENQTMILDGELYNHKMKSDFEKIVSLVRQEEPGEGHEMVQYHIYDTINDDTFSQRTEKLQRLFEMYEFYSLFLVKTDVVKDQDSLIKYFEESIKDGYEGAMVRNWGSEYVPKRSMDLQKLKPFIDEEFPIVGVKTGKGKMSDLAIFQCRAKNGNLFDVKLKGEMESLRKYVEDESTWKGKELTVRYYGLTNKEKVPRFPVGHAVRDYE